MTGMTQDNPSGLTPLEYKVLVRPYEVPKQTAGGLLLPDAHHEREQWAETRGTVVAMAELAFSYDPGAPMPQVGQDVMFAKNTGVTVAGMDGVEYKMLNDKDIIAVVEKRHER